MKIASAASATIAHPLALATFPVACGLFLLFGTMTALTFLLSVLAITITQLVLYEGSKRDKAMHAKLDEILRAIPEARNELIGIESRP